MPEIIFSDQQQTKQKPDDLVLHPVDYGQDTTEFGDANRFERRHEARIDSANVKKAQEEYKALQKEIASFEKQHKKAMGSISSHNDKIVQYSHQLQKYLDKEQLAPLSNSEEDKKERLQSKIADQNSAIESGLNTIEKVYMEQVGKITNVTCDVVNLTGSSSAKVQGQLFNIEKQINDLWKQTHNLATHGLYEQAEYYSDFSVWYEGYCKRINEQKKIKETREQQAEEEALVLSHRHNIHVHLSTSERAKLLDDVVLKEYDIERGEQGKRPSHISDEQFEQLREYYDKFPDYQLTAIHDLQSPKWDIQQETWRKEQENMAREKALRNQEWQKTHPRQQREKQYTYEQYMHDTPSDQELHDAMHDVLNEALRDMNSDITMTYFSEKTEQKKTQNNVYVQAMSQVTPSQKVQGTADSHWQQIEKELPEQAIEIGDR